MKNKMTKEVVPEGFTLGMVVSDLLPVVFFGGATLLVGLLLKNVLIDVGAVIAFLSGLLKVVWKLIVVVKRKNIWSLFLQMRICMPIGFLIFLVGLLMSLSALSFETVVSALIGFPQIVFFILGILGMTAMIVCSVKLDSADAKSNWIEQTINGIAQACIFVGVLLIYLG